MFKSNVGGEKEEKKLWTAIFTWLDLIDGIIPIVIKVACEVTFCVLNKFLALSENVELTPKDPVPEANQPPISKDSCIDAAIDSILCEELVSVVFKTCTIPTNEDDYKNSNNKNAKDGNGITQERLPFDDDIISDTGLESEESEAEEENGKAES